MDPSWEGEEFHFSCSEAEDAVEIEIKDKFAKSRPTISRNLGRDEELTFCSLIVCIYTLIDSGVKFQKAMTMTKCLVRQLSPCSRTALKQRVYSDSARISFGVHHAGFASPCRGC